ncbi:hypothetical protein N9U52_00815 [Prochlorococcus sp. AH-736-N17]|nr:hypothetical protein [Prochlorococcus sp. AH-736-N17]MDA9728772.1 hypothetical protein [Prochlorococcus sp. AH-736-N17]
MLTTKITFALADWIREWRKCRDKNPSIDECVQFVQWKLEDYKLSDSDKRIIESILLYESESLRDYRLYFLYSSIKNKGSLKSSYKLRKK